MTPILPLPPPILFLVPLSVHDPIPAFSVSFLVFCYRLSFLIIWLGTGFVSPPLRDGRLKATAGRRAVGLVERIRARGLLPCLQGLLGMPLRIDITCCCAYGMPSEGPGLAQTVRGGYGTSVDGDRVDDVMTPRE